MFVVRWITKLVSLPFLWLGQLMIMFKQPLSVPLLKAAWYISGDGSTGQIALIAIHRHFGPDATRAQAEAWLDKRPQPEITAFAGMLAVDAGETDYAKELLTYGRELGDSSDGMFEMLEHAIIENTGSPSDKNDLARRFESRRDLPPGLSKAVRTSLLWDDMFDQRFDDARRRAEFLLKVEDVPEAEMVLWAIAKHHGDELKAAGHLERAKMEEAPKIHCRLLGYFAIGLIAEARELLPRLRELDESRADRAEDVLAGKESA